MKECLSRFNKDKIKEQEQVLDIGEIESDYTPNYMDDEELFIKAVADPIRKKTMAKKVKLKPSPSKHYIRIWRTRKQ